MIVSTEKEETAQERTPTAPVVRETAKGGGRTPPTSKTTDNRYALDFKESHLNTSTISGEG